MCAKSSFLIAAAAALASMASAAPATDTSNAAPLAARACGGFGLEAPEWISVKGLDKGDRPDWQWGGFGYKKWEFPFNLPDAYTVEHFEVTKYRQEGEWLGEDTPGLTVDRVYDVRACWPSCQYTR